MWNEAIRRIHIEIAFRALRYCFRCHLGEGFGTFGLRNSVLEPQYFSAFYSDIDVYLTLTNLEDGSISKSRKLFSLAKKIYPFFGELEIYLPQEWVRLKELKADNLIFQRARRVRKIFWIERDLEKTTLSWYQRAKLKRGRVVAVGRAAVPPHLLSDRKNLLLWLTNVSAPAISDRNRSPQSFFHSFFETHVLAPADHQNTGLTLTTSELLRLALFFPLIWSQLYPNFSNFRSDDFTADQWATVLSSFEIEILEFTASMRAHKKWPSAGAYLHGLTESRAAIRKLIGDANSRLLTADSVDLWAQKPN